MGYRFLKTTTVSGFVSDEINPYSEAALGRERTDEEIALSMAWMDRNLRVYSLRGHWSADAIRNFVAKRGLRRAQAKHHWSNLSKPGVLNGAEPVTL